LQRINILCATAYITLKKKDKLSSDINTDLPDKKPVLKKKPKNNLDSENNSTGFSGDISGKQIAINTYNTLIKMLVK
jgi:hypothetical protein